jgi:16S rRNA (uracil1498-N3)-methyltransferase
MLRRAHVLSLKPGNLQLSERDSHHLRDVLRLRVEDEIELFDSVGRTATATVSQITGTVLTVRVNEIREAPGTRTLTLATALPKGERADWLVEKLSELGVYRFIPLQTERSVVHPEGKNKFERWNRIAAESAKQSRRAGVMTIDPLTFLAQALADAPPLVLYLSTDPAAATLGSQLPGNDESLALFIGPEGGWTDDEIQLFSDHKIQPARLTQTILRIETAAISAAAIVQCAVQ